MKVQVLSEQVLPLIRKVRPMLLPHYGRVGHSQKSESPHNVVTTLDQDVERFLCATLFGVDPTIAFVGEEFGGDRSVGRFWLADPIDGTIQFVRGIPFCTTMLALVEQGQVTFSAIYDFLSDTLYHAVRGGGAYKNGEHIRVSKRTAECSCVGFETKLATPEDCARWFTVHEHVLILQTLSAGFEFAMVAEGKIEGRICLDPYGSDYDYAPGTLLVTEAGGIVANIGSSSYDYRNLNFIAAAPTLYRALTEGPNAAFPILSPEIVGS